MSPGWSTGLSVEGHPDWPGQSDAGPGQSGLAAVLVARRRRVDKISVCGYLVDTYCLGVKDALGPRNFDDRALPAFIQQYFGTFDGDAIPAPLELAQDLVFGAVLYARSLGFDPHPDLRRAAGHLGGWTGPSAITFGDNGKPFYIEGPHDDAVGVMETLERSVGRDGFHFIATLR